MRYALRAGFLDEFGKQEFFVYRKSGVEPSAIPPEVTQAAIDWTLALSDESIYTVQARPDFQDQPPKGSFNKSLCSKYGEIVFERYLRARNTKLGCPGCSKGMRVGGPRRDAAPERSAAKPRAPAPSGRV